MNPYRDAPPAAPKVEEQREPAWPIVPSVILAASFAAFAWLVYTSTGIIGIIGAALLVGSICGRTWWHFRAHSPRRIAMRQLRIEEQADRWLRQFER